VSSTTLIQQSFRRQTQKAIRRGCQNAAVRLDRKNEVTSSGPVRARSRFGHSHRAGAQHVQSVGHHGFVTGKANREARVSVRLRERRGKRAAERVEVDTPRARQRGRGARCARRDRGRERVCRARLRPSCKQSLSSTRIRIGPRHLRRSVVAVLAPCRGHRLPGRRRGCCKPVWLRGSTGPPRPALVYARTQHIQHARGTLDLLASHERVSFGH
jgi:hypothetical protein